MFAPILGRASQSQGASRAHQISLADEAVSRPKNHAVHLHDFT